MSQPETPSEPSEISFKITTSDSTPAALFGNLAQLAERSLVQYWLKTTNKATEPIEIEDQKAISVIGKALGIRMTLLSQGGQTSLEMTLPLRPQHPSPTKPQGQ